MTGQADLLKRTRVLKFDSPARQARIAQIMALIQYKAMTVAQIAEAIDLPVANTNDYLNHLYGKNGSPKRIYVWSWLRAGTEGRRTHVRIWAAGEDRDAPMPRARTEAEQSKITRRRIKQDPERFMHYKAMQKKRDIRRNKHNTKPKADPLVALFFGRAA